MQLLDGMRDYALLSRKTGIECSTGYRECRGTYLWK